MQQSNQTSKPMNAPLAFILFKTRQAPDGYIKYVVPKASDIEVTAKTIAR